MTAKWISLISSTAAALCVTAALSAWNHHAAVRHASDEAVTLARQTASQVEGLAMDARGRGERDPLGWAVRMAAQAAEPRIFKVLRLDASQVRAASLDEGNHLFDYSKVVTDEDGGAVRVQVRVPYLGAFGTHSRWSSDLAVALIGLSLFFVSLVTFRAFRRPQVITVEAPAAAAAPVESGIGAHVTELLNAFSLNLRDLLRNVSQLVRSTRSSQKSVAELRAKIHERLSLVHSANREESRQIEKNLETVRKLAALAATYSGKLGPQGKTFQSITQEIAKLAEKTTALHFEQREKFADVERDLEPWAVDVDQAFHAFAEFTKTTGDLTSQLERTTGTLHEAHRLTASAKK